MFGFALCFCVMGTMIFGFGFSYGYARRRRDERLESGMGRYSNMSRYQETFIVEQPDADSTNPYSSPLCR